MFRWHYLALLALGIAATTSGCTCQPQTGGTPAGTPGKLSPLPEAPQIVVSPEALPGAAGDLAVVAARPTGNAVGDLRPTITFSKPVVALGEAAPPAVATLEPALEGEWRWLGSASVEFVPKGLVPYSTAFKVTVPAGLTALDGSKLAAPYQFEFNTPAPELQQLTPRDGYAWLAREAQLALLFNQPVKDLPAHARLLVGEGQQPVALKIVKEVSIAEEQRAAEQQQRRYARPSFEEKGTKNRQTRYELQPASPLPLDSAVTLVVDAALAGQEGPLTLGQELRYGLRTYGKMEVVGARGCVVEYEGAQCHWGPLVLVTTNRADVASLKGKVTLDPPAEIRWDDAESFVPEPWSDLKQPWVVLPGAFRPGTTYKLKVAAGTKDEFGQSAPAFEGSFKLDDLEPSFSLGAEVALLEAGGDGALPIESVNLASGKARIWSLTPEQLAPLLAWESWSDKPEPQPAGVPVELDVDLTAARNAQRFFPLPLRKALPEGRRTGLFLATFSSPQLPQRKPDRVLAQITDLAVHAKLGPKSSALWVTSISTGKPIAGAQVRILDRSGTARWTGVSDADGVARAPGLAELIAEKTDTWSTPFAMAVAEKDGDAGATLSSWSDGISPWSFELSGDWDGREPKSLGMIFADRGLFRPGDEVQLKGLARYRSVGDIRRPAPGTRLEIKVVSPRGDEVYKESVAVSEFGTFGAKVPVGKESPLGIYQVTAAGRIDGEEIEYGGSFRVEEYRAPQFKVDLSTPNANLAAGEPLRATVLARYLFGGAMAGAQVRWSAARTSIAFEPPGNQGFAFGTLTWWWDDEQPAPTNEVVGGGEGTTDPQGAWELQAGKTEAPAGKTWEYTVEAEVTDVNRQRVADRTVVTVHPAEVYAGARLAAAGFAEAGKPAKLELVAASPEGARVAGRPIAVEVKRREWKSIRKKGVGGEWFTINEPVETKVADCQVKSEATPVGCELKPEQPGLHLVEATVTDEAGRKQVTRSSFYVIGSGWVSWQRNDTERIDLVADKQLYDVGETAKILVKSPYPSAEALVTVEREGVFSVRRVQLQGAASTIEIPLDESLVPNAFVGVLIARGRVPTDQGLETGEDPGRPAVRVGYTELRVEKKSKRLEVKLTPDAVEKRPRDKVKVDLAVTDWKGKGQKSEVTVWAVDEAVLRLTGYQVPDPIEAIHPLRGLSVRIGEPLLHLVLARLYGEKGETTGGSGGGDTAGAAFRSRFKTTVLFTSVVTDERGHAVAEFELPDNLTTFRLMAVAATQGDLFGAGESKVTVSKPLLALPSLPRFALVGDKLEAGVVVHTHGAQFGEVQVKAQADGLGISGPSVQTLSLADGKPREVRFNFEAATAGTATLRFSVEGGSERDGVEQKLPVHLPVSMEAVATYGDTSGKATEGLLPPGGVRPGIGGLDVTLASTALGNFDEGMRQLVEYPYGCVEQLGSRLVPFIALRELHGKFGVPYQAPAKVDETEALLRAWLGEPALELHGTKDPDEVVRLTVKAIEQLQNPDGGYRYWASGTCSAQWASAYAVLALGRAAEVGYPVDRKGLENGQRFLADNVAAGKCVECGWGCTPADAPTRVFALYALARTKAPKPSYYGAHFAERQKLPLFSQAMLADAMFVGKGDRAQAKQLLSELMNHAKESPAELHFEETDPRTYAALWSSDLRTTAIVLQTLVDLTPDHPYVGKIGRYLVKARRPDGSFRNTQEAAFSLMALAEVVRVKEKQAPDFVAKVLLGGEQLAAVPFQGRSLGVERKSVPIDQLAGKSGKQSLEFVRDGNAGVLYYGALLRYAPAELPTEPLDRGMVVQRWFEPYEGGGQARAFFAGDLVRIRVRVGTPMERNFVAIEVPLPAGLEAVDTSLATTARLPSQPQEEGPGEGYEYESAEDQSKPANPFAEAFYSPFNHVEIRDDRVLLFSDRLPPGVHVASFVARATTPGDFVLKPARAEEMYSPEVFGRADGGRFTVALPRPVAGK